jgi:hypothetical protein
MTWFMNKWLIATSAGRQNTTEYIVNPSLINRWCPAHMSIHDFWKDFDKFEHEFDGRIINIRVQNDVSEQGNEEFLGVVLSTRSEIDWNKNIEFTNSLDTRIAWCVRAGNASKNAWGDRTASRHWYNFHNSHATQNSEMLRPAHSEETSEKY